MLNKLEIWSAENKEDPAMLKQLMADRIIPFINNPETRRKQILQMKPIKWVKTTYTVGDSNSTGYFEIFQFEKDFLIKEPETAFIIAAMQCMGGEGSAESKEKMEELSSEMYIANTSEEDKIKDADNLLHSLLPGENTELEIYQCDYGYAAVTAYTGATDEETERLDELFADTCCFEAVYNYSGWDSLMGVYIIAVGRNKIAIGFPEVFD